MGGILAALCLRFAAGCGTLALLLLVAAFDATQAQQPYQALPALELEWKLLSASPNPIVHFCVGNAGKSRSGPAELQVVHQQTLEQQFEKIRIRPLLPDEPQCWDLEFRSRPEWRGRTETFVAVVVPLNIQRKVPITFPDVQSRGVDLALEIFEPYLDDLRAYLIVPFRVTNVGTQRSPNTVVEFRLRTGQPFQLNDPVGPLLGTYSVPALAVGVPFDRQMRLRYLNDWIDRAVDFTAVVGPPERIGDANPWDNRRAFSYPAPLIIPGGGSSYPPDDGFLPILAILALAALIGFVIWVLRKQKGTPLPPKASTFRVIAHPDAGTQSIQLKRDDVAFPDVRVRPVLDGGSYEIAIQSAEK
jgi:hypothetical protein